MRPPSVRHATELGEHARQSGQEEAMKHLTRALLLVAWFSLSGALSYAEPHQIFQGTQIHLKLLSDVGTAASRNGDPFVALTTEPLVMGDGVILPAGTRIRGVVTAISRAHRFALFRGEAYLNLAFRSIEVDSRLIPVEMSVLAVDKPSGDGEPRPRKDLDVSEGQLLQEKRDIKGDIIAGTIGTGGATLIGKLAAHAAPGFGIGLAGSAVMWPLARAGKSTCPPKLPCSCAWTAPLPFRASAAARLPATSVQSACRPGQRYYFNGKFGLAFTSSICLV